MSSSSKEVHLEQVKENQKIKYANNPYFNLEQKYQIRINNYFGEQKYKAADLLGCSINWFKKWIDFRMKPGMNYDNTEIEHVIPLKEIKNKNDENEIREYFNWTNTMPLLVHDNKVKGIKRDENIEKEHEKYVQAFLTANFGE